MFCDGDASLVRDSMYLTSSHCLWTTHSDDSTM